MRISRTFLFALVLCVAVAGIVEAGVNTDWDRAYDFSKIKTYAWKQGTPLANTAGVSNDLMQKRFEATVDEHLTAAGWKKVDSDADVLVTTHGSSKTNTSISGFIYSPVGWRWGGWGTSSYSVNDFPVGSLLVDILSPNGKDLLWRGAGHDIMVSTNPDKNTKKIEKTVAKMFKEFPPSDEPK